nr:receptor-like protein 15 [Populus alba]
MPPALVAAQPSPPPQSPMPLEDRSVNRSVEITTKSISYLYNGIILNLISGIDFSCNNLTGEIPFELGNLSNIKLLNLSHNSLTGPIPPTFSNLKEIETLDLSYNNLNGEIPPQLIDLYSLSAFSVAHNNLSGKTPEMVAQFSTFNESCYEGNPLLCGPPLAKNCTGGIPPSPLPRSQNHKKEENGVIDMEAFYVTFSVAYIMVLLAIGAVLYINPQWRQAWFYFIGESINNCYYFLVDNLPVSVRKSLELARRVLANQRTSTRALLKQSEGSNPLPVAASLSRSSFGGSNNDDRKSGDALLKFLLKAVASGVVIVGSSLSFSNWYPSLVSSDDLLPHKKKKRFLYSYRRRVFFNYEKRIRLQSPPEKLAFFFSDLRIHYDSKYALLLIGNPTAKPGGGKVFEYFASFKTPDGEVLMTPADLMRAVVPVFPPSESNRIRECIFFVTLLSIPESSFSVAFKMFDLDNNGWEGVTCSNSTTRRVVEIHLVTNLPIYEYSHWYLNASIFLPFQELNVLDLSGKGIAGCVANEEIDSLSELEVLSLSGNNIHNFSKSRGFSNLSVLYLDYSKASVFILQSLSAFPNLKALSLRDNLNPYGFGQGELPNLKFLERLDLTESSLVNYNFLQTVGKFTSLKSLVLPYSGLSGPIFAPQGLCELKHLQELDISYNNLTGSLPSCFSNLTNLQALDISFNHFTGNTSLSSIGSLTSIRDLKLVGTQFDSKVPVAKPFFGM